MNYCKLICLLLPLGIAQTASATTDLIKKSSTADHSQFDALNRDIETGPEVTEACLECHTEASKQLHQTTRTWVLENELTGVKGDTPQYR